MQFLKMALGNKIKNGNLEDSSYKKPSMSYAQLVAEALNNAPEKTLVLWHIFKAIKTKYPYYALETNGWQNNIRRMLPSNKNFIRGNKSSLGWNWKLADNHSIPPLKVQKVYAYSKYKICSECKKGFTSPDELKYHVAKVHSFVKEGNFFQQTMEKDNSNSEPDEDPGNKRPYMSYAQLIAEALKTAPEQTLVLSDIYKAIRTKHPYYGLETTPSWQNSIRQTLTLNKNFIKGKPSAKRGWNWKLSKDVPISFFETKGKSYFAKKRKGKHEKKCEFCNEDFETRVNLIKHIRGTHGVETSNLEKRLEKRNQNT